MRLWARDLEGRMFGRHYDFSMELLYAKNVLFLLFICVTLGFLIYTNNVFISFLYTNNVAHQKNYTNNMYVFSFIGQYVRILL